MARMCTASLSGQFAFQLFQIIPAVETAAVTVAEPRADGVIALKLPALDCDTWKFLGAVAAVLIPQNIDFTFILSAGGVLAEKFRGEVTFAIVGPDDAELAADELDVFGCFLHLAIQNCY